MLHEFHKEMQKNPEMVEYIKQYTDKYKNPSNIQQIIEELKECKNLGEVKKLTERVFPDWFVTMIPEFSLDYPQFQQNWQMVCQKANVTPKQIMIVEEVEQGPDYSLVQSFAECFTRAGFCVRKKMEFFPSENTGRALPSPIVYAQLVEKGIAVPEWGKTCKKCD